MFSLQPSTISKSQFFIAKFPGLSPTVPGLRSYKDYLQIVSHENSMQLPQES